MNSTLLWIALASMLVGVFCGGVIVFLIFTVRRKILANSLSHNHSLIGRIGIVHIPFDHRSKGKIRVHIDHSTREFIALTDYPHAFQPGDQVLIIQIKNSFVYVIPADILHESI